jgi:hypothetical protein
MADALFSDLLALHEQGRTEAALDRLIEQLRAERRWHKLFDARLLKRKWELGLPLSRPSSLQDVPQAQRKLVEETYIEAAREAGLAWLAEGDIPAAWMYLSVIRDPAPIRDAIDALPVPTHGDDAAEQVVRIALFEGVHPTKGVQMMLKLHGTCSTITALDQALGNLPQPERRACATVMVRELYRDLRESVERDVRQKLAVIPPDLSLRELITGRDWLFEKGNYHIDVSHLNSVVRFARSIESPEDLELALELAEYGGRLDPQLQYGGDPPFDDFYPAHIQFFRALLGRDRSDALGYFREKLAAEPDERDQPLLAYVLVDLLVRCGERDEAVDVAARHLTNLSEDVLLSFFDLCAESGRFGTLRDAMQAKDDPVGFAAALAAEQYREKPAATA